MACFSFLCFSLLLLKKKTDFYQSLSKCPKLVATLMLSDSGQEAVQLRQDIAGVTSINEALPTVMDEPAVDI